MTTPSLFFCHQKQCARHYPHCVFAGLAVQCSCPCVLHMLFYSKPRTQLTDYSDWQAARACLLLFVVKQTSGSCYAMLSFQWSNFLYIVDLVYQIVCTLKKNTTAVCFGYKTIFFWNVIYLLFFYFNLCQAAFLLGQPCHFTWQEYRWHAD